MKLRDFEGQITGLVILFLLIIFPTLVVLTAQNHEYNNNKPTFSEKKQTLKDFAKKNNISILEKELSNNGQYLYVDGEICYQGMINKISFRIENKDNIEVLNLKPKEIEVESNSASGGSLVLLGGFSSNGRKQMIIKCKNSIDTIKY